MYKLFVAVAIILLGIVVVLQLPNKPLSQPLQTAPATTILPALFTGVISKIDGDKLTVTGVQTNTPATYIVTLNSKTILTKVPYSPNYLFKAAKAPAATPAQRSDLTVGSTIIVRSTNNVATSIDIMPGHQAVVGIITEMGNNSFTIQLIPALAPLQIVGDKLVGKKITVKVTPDTEISRLLSSEGGQSTPTRFSFSQLRQGMAVTVFTDGEVDANTTSVNALHVEPLISSL